MAECLKSVTVAQSLIVPSFEMNLHFDLFAYTHHVPLTLRHVRTVFVIRAALYVYSKELANSYFAY